MEEIKVSELHTRIVLTFLEKVELLTPREREVIVGVIELISKPVFITK